MISAAAYIFGGQWIGQLGRDRLMRGFGVLGLGEFVVRVSRIVTAIVLARYLTAAELGIAATAIACFELCRVLANNGIGQAVIRVSQERLAATCNTAYRLAWIVCGVSAAVQVSAGYVIARATGRDDLFGMIACLSGVYVFMPAGMVQYWLLQRSYRMSAIATVNTLQVGTDNLLTALLAVLGAGPWAIVIPKLLTAPIWLGTIRYFVSWQRDADAGREPALGMLAFSAPILASEMLVALRFNLDKMLVGAILGVEALGIYYFAFNAGYGLSLVLTGALASASFPHLAENRISPTELIARFDGALLRLAVPISALIVLQAAAVFVYVPILFGAQWGSATLIVAVLCLSAATKAWHDLSTQLLRAAGLPGIEFCASAVFTVVLLGFLALAMPFGLLAGVTTLSIVTMSMQILFAAWARRLVVGRLQFPPFAPSGTPRSEGSG